MGAHDCGDRFVAFDADRASDIATMLVHRIDLWPGYRMARSKSQLGKENTYSRQFHYNGLLPGVGGPLWAEVVVQDSYGRPTVIVELKPRPGGRQDFNVTKVELRRDGANEAGGVKYWVFKVQTHSGKEAHTPFDYPLPRDNFAPLLIDMKTADEGKDEQRLELAVRACFVVAMVLHEIYNGTTNPGPDQVTALLTSVVSSAVATCTPQ